MDPPPILEKVEDHLLEYITTPENLPIHEYARNQEFWPRVPDPGSLFEYDNNSSLATALKVERDLNTGEIIQFHEVLIEGANRTAQNSMLLSRMPMSSPDDAVWGSISNYPFWPGGLLDPLKELSIDENAITTDELLTVPPGFEHGLRFAKDGITVINESENVEPVDTLQERIIDMTDILDTHDFLGIWETPQQVEDVESTELSKAPNLPEEEDVIPKEMPIINISKPMKSILDSGTEWAILLDTSKPVKDFKERVPHMAIEYDFELDTFQKLAIIQLEKHNHVFVAAHTSAGKTVVAEYAIALSQKHMTRSIYTSPIKALSNQKYRDFRQKFQDVGLVTGDFQINIKASCLIMTTEILRTMLFGGSEVTRDLEYVIFDEVHYINDKERGYVWEQVLIMLPEHVCVVLLSATVPNTIEFADWLGRTYKKKVYVVSTHKRPVPLEHYLYTGTGGSSRDNRFLILNEQGQFVSEGYIKAQNSLKKEQKAEKEPIKQRKHTQHHQYKPYDKSNMIDTSGKTIKTMWDGLVAHLLKSTEDPDGLLPAVAFTFSRQKCDNYAELLKHLDLTTKTEKFEIETFFEKCIKGLKAPDREVPQIVKMRTILSRGIGVHHSGILPIVKEMIEMLFQKRLVKLLFATETFAMGINMPARTVVFDSIRKHDGKELRNLQSAEYIQMAGRAGRRGKDKTGTVIILCKGATPELGSLKGMMLGKPNQLTSQFRITYGMVLSLLRVERLSVESIISRTFREASHQKKQEDVHKQLEDVERDYISECSRELSEYMEPLIKFYEAASVYLTVREQLLPHIMHAPCIQKELVPGRVVLITHNHHVNKLALILIASIKTINHTYKVLVLCEQETIGNSKSDTWYKMVSFTKSQVYCPVAVPQHQIITIGPLDVFEITSKIIKVDTDLVLKDWEKRQMPRFYNDPPGQTFAVAVQELYNLSLNSLSNSQASYYYLDIRLTELDLYNDRIQLNLLKDKLLDCVNSTQIPNFEEQFLVVFAKKSLEDKRNYLKHQLSYTSLSLYPEYENRLRLLRKLRYVDDKNRVELKGKVACEMGSNELLITELVVRNELAHFHPAEIAALLSSLVFQAKTYYEPELTPELKKGKEIIMGIHEEITKHEQSFSVDKVSETSKEPNFGLVEVVYEWARSKPFAEIMLLTDIQEGIIVRCIQQLNETICDVRSAARITGDSKFQNKMEEASTAIKRDIVFAESLYTTNEKF